MKLRLYICALALTLCVAFGVSLAENNKSPAVANATGDIAQYQLTWLSINSGGATGQFSTNFAAGLSCGQVEALLAQQDGSNEPKAEFGMNK